MKFRRICNLRCVVLRVISQKFMTTVVMSTHDAQIVDQMRRRVVELENGHVVRDQSRGVYGYAR